MEPLWAKEGYDSHSRAVNDLVSRYADMLFRIASLRLSSRADAEDAVQTVFLTYLTKRKLFASDEHCKAWLIRVVINLCHNINKRNSARRTESLEVLSGETPAEETSTVLREIMALSPHYRDVIYLHYYEGYKLREIARLLRKNESTVGTWLVRAREQLKLQLTGDE